MKSIVIPPTGRIHALDTPGATVAHELLGDTEVVTLRHPAMPPRSHVMWVGALSALDGSPLNRRAWALYGGSPIFGTAVVASDTGDDVEPLFDLVIDDAFPGAEIDTTMTEWLREHAL